MERGKGPFPSVAFKTTVDDVVEAPIQVSYSGELTASIVAGNLGAVRGAGLVRNVFLSVGASGKDDSDPLQVSGEVKINGTSCLSTKPSISHVSGESSQQKTTKVSGDTGIAQAVMDHDNRSFIPGDVLTYDLTQVRTATPTTEMSSVCLVVEFESAKNVA